MGGGIPFRGRALCEALRLRWSLMYNATLFQIAVIVHAVSTSTIATAFVSRGTICTLPCVNCLRKPATGSFIAEIGAASDRTYFLFRKKKQKCATAQEGGK